jgi:hypothetical protein
MDNLALIADVESIASALNRTTGKYTEAEMVALFIDDESYSEEARLIAAEDTKRAFSRSWKGSYEFTHGVVAHLDVTSRIMARDLKVVA